MVRHTERLNSSVRNGWTTVKNWCPRTNVRRSTGWSQVKMRLPPSSRNLVLRSGNQWLIHEQSHYSWHQRCRWPSICLTMIQRGYRVASVFCVAFEESASLGFMWILFDIERCREKVHVVLRSCVSRKPTKTIFVYHSLIESMSLFVFSLVSSFS